MVTSAEVNAFTVSEAAVKVAEIYAAFGDKVDIDVTILANENDKPAEEPVGYSFTWLKTFAGARKKALVEELTGEISTAIIKALERQFKTQEETIMGIKTGGIEFNVITDMTKLPQKVASAASEIENARLMGAGYKPIIFCGTQVVNGVNYWFVAEQTRTTNPPEKHLVKLAVNESGGKLALIDKSIEVIF